MRIWKLWRRHVSDDLSAFLDGLLPQQEAARVTDHLRNCESCRREYDEVRFGAALATQLSRASAPAGLWSSIEQRWAERTTVALPAAEKPRWQTIRRPALAMAFSVLGLGLGVIALTRFGLLHRSARPSHASRPSAVGGSRITPAVSSPHLDLGPFLDPLGAASPEQSYRLISTAYPSFVTIDRQEALRAAGLSALVKVSPLPGYKLMTYRVSKAGDCRVVQLVYAKGKETFSVFVAPRELEFSYGKETCLNTKVRGIPCQRIDCPQQESYVFGEGRFRCALVSKSLSAEKVARVMRYFISAHKRREDER